jgi:PAS domain S-box-containing protein
MARIKILVVEDEIIVAKDIKMRLENLGYSVSSLVSSGEEAIREAEENNPDLVLMDIVLQGEMDGIEAADQIRSHFNIPVIYLTAYADEKMLERAKRTGPFGYIIKPFDDRDLHTTIEVAFYKNKMEKRLRESERWLFTTLRSINEAVIATDTKGCVTLMNHVAQSLTGWKEEDATGRPLRDIFNIINEKTQKPVGDPVRRVLREGVVVGLANDTVLIAKDGTQRPIDDSGAPIRDDKGNIMGVVLVFRDVSERRKAEKEKMKLEDQLQQAQKMETIGTLAGGIAHDFNNLLMGIQGNVSLMLMDMDSTHPYHDRLKNIENQVQSGARLISHLIGYARKGRYEVKPITLNQLVKETSDTFGRTRKKITIHRELAEDLFAIEADQTQIEQVLLNLFVNAADAMSGGGSLILKTMNTTHKEIKGKLYDPKPGNYVLLMVADTGIGIDKETMERIFDPFFTTKEMGRSTGLGLASAYGIIKSHGGYIDVDSKKGRGSIFSIYLPASEKGVQKPIKTAEPFIKRSGTVLLVDDEEVILEVGQKLLEAMGYRALIARNGKEAVEVYKKNRDEIDIVLLDMLMPNMGGGEAYDRMKEINPDIKVLLSSGFSIDGEATEILKRGCDSFIQKPFNIDELSGKIREILDNK